MLKGLRPHSWKFSLSLVHQTGGALSEGAFVLEGVWPGAPVRRGLCLIFNRALTHTLSVSVYIFNVGDNQPL